MIYSFQAAVGNRREAAVEEEARDDPGARLAALRIASDLAARDRLKGELIVDARDPDGNLAVSVRVWCREERVQAAEDDFVHEGEGHPS
jgi:hypothetical protein